MSSVVVQPRPDGPAPSEKSAAAAEAILSVVMAPLSALITSLRAIHIISQGDSYPEPDLKNIWEVNHLLQLTEDYNNKLVDLLALGGPFKCQCKGAHKGCSCGAAQYANRYNDLAAAKIKLDQAMLKNWDKMMVALELQFSAWIELNWVKPVRNAEIEKIRDETRYGETVLYREEQKLIATGEFTTEDFQWFNDWFGSQTRWRIYLEWVLNDHLDGERDRLVREFGLFTWAEETGFFERFDPLRDFKDVPKPLGCNCNPKKPDEEIYLPYLQGVLVSPIVLDLDGDGVETTNVNSSKTMFDFDGDGVKNRTGWVSPDDGFLVFDRNGDGIINNGREMFGNHTLRYDGQGTCRDGYEALAQEDTNGDGVVNHLDDNWQHFRVWRDLNQNGITDEGELFTLEELGITSFDVGYSGGNTTQNGNTLQGGAAYYDINGDAHGFSDVWFEQNTFYSQFPDMEIPEDLRDLPVMDGSGNVRPILQACAGSEALADIYRQMSEATGHQNQIALVEDLLYTWASTSGMVATYEARARACGAEGVFHNNLPMSAAEWDRILHVV